MEMWEILVPVCSNDGDMYQISHHQVWDEKVRAISGGMTILEPAKGQWLTPYGYWQAEKVIPVRIIATREEMEKVVDMTLEYYEQESVLAYRISNEIIRKQSSKKVKEPNTFII